MKTVSDVKGDELTRALLLHLQLLILMLLGESSYEFRRK